MPDWDSAYLNRETPWARNPHHLADWLRLTETRTALDLGCGSGLYAKILSDRGFNVLGLDSSQEAVALAKKNAPGARFLVFDLKNLANIPGSEHAQYDLILDIKTFAFIEDKAAYLGAVRRLIAPGGFFILQFASRSPKKNLEVTYTDFPFTTARKIVDSTPETESATYFFQL